eukprot:15336713-Ditylum_brightwellii.AAC.1
MVEFPLDYEFRNVVVIGMIKWCPIIASGIENATKVFRPNASTIIRGNSQSDSGLSGSRLHHNSSKYDQTA